MSRAATESTLQHARSGDASRRTFFRSSLAILSLSAFPALAAAAERLSFDTLYKSSGVLGIQYSERALALRGKPIVIRGFMAPPLKPESTFFVLTREPVSVCPFCASDAEWPVDIIVVYLQGTLSPVDFTQRLQVEGRLEIGSWTDPQTGFVSQVRLRESTVSKI
jgi:hypothetical protein